MESKSTSWIWVRGLVREKAHWYDFESEFRKFFPDVEIECLDLPGNGEHWQLKSKTSVEANTDFLRQNSRLIAEKKRPFVLSISLGSMIAIDWAYRFPEEVQGVVCMNTSLREENSFLQRLRPRSYPDILRFFAETKNPLEREKLVLKLTSKRVGGVHALAEKAAKIAEERPVSPANAVRQTLAAARFSSPKSRAKRPFLFLNSLRDDLVDPKCTERVAALVGGDFLSHPTAGHDLPLDDGPWVAERVHEWVESLT